MNDDRKADLLKLAAKIKKKKKPKKPKSMFSRGASGFGNFAGDVGKFTKPLLGAAGGVVSLLAARKAIKSAIRDHKLSKLHPVKKFFAEGQPGRRALGFGLGATAFAGGVKGIDALAEGISDPFSKRNAFNNMMNENPSLKKEPKRDVKMIFNTLYRFNPKMAGDPLVAGSFMRRSLQFKDEGIQPADIKTLTEIGRNVVGAKSRDGILSNAFATSAGELAGFM